MPSATATMSAPLTAAQRRRVLFAAISCVAVFGVAIGVVIPLLSVLLERRGVDSSLNGINAAASFLGVVVGPLFAPFFVRRLGIQPFLAGCLLLEVALWPPLKLTDNLALWFALRFLAGLIGSSFFTATEAWINVVAEGPSRGRIIGLYAVCLSAGFAAGPLLLTVTGFSGWTPFIAGMLLELIAGLPLLFTRGLAEGFGRGERASLRAMLARAPLILFAVILFGLYEGTAQVLLPVWSLRLGFDPPVAASTLTAIYVGAIALQFPVGWLSDHMARLSVLRLCGVAGLCGAALLPLVASTPMLLFALLLLWGGLASGLYPVALSMAGDRFQGAEMVTANAALVMGYGLGALAGPVIGGGAMDLVNPHGLVAVFVTVFALFLAASYIMPDRGRRLSR